MDSFSVPTYVLYTLHNEIVEVCGFKCCSRGHIATLLHYDSVGRRDLIRKLDTARWVLSCFSFHWLVTPNWPRSVSDEGVLTQRRALWS